MRPPASSTGLANNADAAAVPLVKWAGGKRSLIAQLRQYIPAEFCRYYEPFLGGGAFFFALGHARAVVGDANPDLMGLYEAVAADADAVMAELDAMQPHVLDAEYYYDVRSRAPSDLSPARSAARFIFLNKTCYNGLYRVNRAGQFNVPFGRYHQPPRLYARENVERAARLLRDADLWRGDFETILAGAGPGDFVYLDPPYAPLTSTANFTRYTSAAFEEPEQRRLAARVRELDRKGCFVLLSNSDTPLVRELYAGFALDVVHAPRNINSDPTARSKIRELAIHNYRPIASSGGTDARTRQGDE